MVRTCSSNWLIPENWWVPFRPQEIAFLQLLLLSKGLVWYLPLRWCGRKRISLMSLPQISPGWICSFSPLILALAALVLCHGYCHLRIHILSYHHIWKENFLCHHNSLPWPFEIRLGHILFPLGTCKTNIYHLGLWKLWALLTFDPGLNASIHNSKPSCSM